ncbi:MAG: NAD(P)/FAD-dependent oxidoreductase [Planctomycetes bacterium]|nr:NAD(P)/FAD-dependent oxidoreductase [Planctomycetota bacterium]
MATAIFAARLMPTRSVVVLDGAGKLGAKILISGGGRCNITNCVVTPADFFGGSPNAIKRVLAALPVARTVAFFREIGVELCEEEHGKLFPKTNQARTVLEAMIGEASRLGVRILLKHRVTSVRRDATGFHIATDAATLSAGNVVLATGGRSLPKTGSDGSGYRLAESLGHTLVPLTPALVALVLDGVFHVPLSGISHEVELTVEATGWKPVRVCGVMLWTHFGVSGPATLDLSRHWHRARLEQRKVEVFANLVGGMDTAAIEGQLFAIASAQPRIQLCSALAQLIPSRLAGAILAELKVSGTTPMAHLPKDFRRKVVKALVRWHLPVRDSRGYKYAEVTAGGVPFVEVNSRTLGSRKCPGLYLPGEILDVDGRIGGFNFQWAWASAWVVATAMARPAKPDPPATE